MAISSATANGRRRRGARRAGRASDSHTTDHRDLFAYFSRWIKDLSEKLRSSPLVGTRD
jgi:hypothetical protein